MGPRLCLVTGGGSGRPRSAGRRPCRAARRPRRLATTAWRAGSQVSRWPRLCGVNSGRDRRKINTYHGQGFGTRSGELTFHCSWDETCLHQKVSTPRRTAAFTAAAAAVRHQGAARALGATCARIPPPPHPKVRRAGAPAVLSRHGGALQAEQLARVRGGPPAWGARQGSRQQLPRSARGVLPPAPPKPRLAAPPVRGGDPPPLTGRGGG